ncbi:MAG TPA: NAD-dependent epimerase/dehydratase family protein [Chitinophagales bacterium]|nr:NAD-dependent epimerase/dehydratase family protein [Chitinophagales bacterium]
MLRRALVLGGGGFIGNHLVNRLKAENYWVRAVDLKYPDFSESSADDFVIGDLRDPRVVASIIKSPAQKSADDKQESFDEVYQLAADMGGAGYIFSGCNDANVMHNSAMINLNVAYEASNYGVKKVFYSSSACMYPAYNQEDPDNPKCSEESAYPANPDSEYGWEKLFSERLFLAFNRNFGLNVRVARFHNIFGPMGTWRGGKEKAPAALCRKVIECPDNSAIEVWGDGLQTRSFLYIDECLEGVRRLMDSDFAGPVNIGSEEMLSINDFAKMIIGISGKNVTIKNVPGFTGVRGRNSDNNLIREKLGWAPGMPLKEGMERTYKWIEGQVLAEKAVKEPA